MVDKTIKGLGKDRVILDDGEWWKLAVPFEGDRLEYIGCKIKSLRVIDNKMELIVDKERRLYLRWRDEHGNEVGPEFPEVGRIRCWDVQQEDPFWDKLDQYIRVVERVIARSATDESESEGNKRRDGE